MNGDVRPVVVASQCLGFAAVRYNGAIIDDAFVQRLAQFADIVEVCPEVGIGLGVPRPPIRMQTAHSELAGAIALVQPSTGREITDDVRAYADSFLASLVAVDGFVLKARSPSCGTHGVNVYDGDSMDVATTAPGRFAAAVLERFPDVAVADELTLRGDVAREHFLTRIYAFARLRRAAAAGTGAALVAFHTRYKYLLMSFDPGRMTALGRIVADGPADAERFAAYRALLAYVLARPAGGGGQVNALMHMAGYISDRLAPGRRADLSGAILAAAASPERRRAATALLREVVREQENGYLGDQAFFDPFPAALMADVAP